MAKTPGALPATVKNARLVNLITLADQIVREQHLGYSGNYTFTLSRQTLIEAAHLTPQIVDAAIKKLVGRIEPRAESLGLGKTSTTELFQQALAQANKELGRVSGQLAASNRKLTVRAQFFEALSQFQGELRPDAAPQIVLQAIAQTAIGVLAVPCAAAFSLPPGHSYAETLLCDSDGHVFATSLVDLPTNQPGLKANEPLDDSTELAQALGPAHVTATYVRPPVSRAGDGPVLIAGEELEWFVATVSPRLRNDKRFWICLEADGHCVGGVVWGAEAAEVQRLSPQLQELATIANGWALALRTAQIREEALALVRATGRGQSPASKRPNRNPPQPHA